MSTSLEALVTSSVSNKTKTILNELIQEALDGMKRLALEAETIYCAVGKDASGAEQAVTVNGLAVGDLVKTVMPLNSNSGAVLVRDTAYRGTVVTVNTLNQLTTNLAGIPLMVVKLNRASR